MEGNKKINENITRYKFIVPGIFTYVYHRKSKIWCYMEEQPIKKLYFDDCKPENEVVRFKEVYEPSINFMIDYKIPMKKVVVIPSEFGCRYISVNEALYIYSEEYIKKHTIQIEDKSKFDNLDKQAVIALEAKIAEELN